LPLVLGIVGGVLVLAMAGGGAVYYLKKSKSVALPVDPKMLPSQTSEVATQLIEATREPDERVRRAYVAAELGSDLCDPGAENPARKLEELGSRTSRSAKELFFDKKRLEQTGKLLECGSLLGASLHSPYQAAIAFEEGDKKQRVAVGHFTFTEIPETHGFTPYTYRGIGGFCKTERTPLGGLGGFGGGIKPKDDKECNENDHGAFRQETTWFLGPRAALESMAVTVKRPKEELTTRISDLKEAAQQTEGLPVAMLQASPKSSKDFFAAPCFYGATHAAVPMLTFLEGCFPAKKLERQLQEIDAKIKAAAYETDGDPQKAAAFHGNVLFVTRDDEGAKIVEKDVKEIVEEWKTHLEANHSKLINDSRKDAATARHKKFAAIADVYFTALEKSTVTRKGRTIKLTFNQKLSDGDLRALEEADTSTVEKRRAVTDILDALQAKKPVPEGPLATLVGKSWAAYLTKPAPEGSTREPMTPGDCRSVQARISRYNLKDKAFSKPGSGVMFIQHKYADCATNPPEVDGVQRQCLRTFTNVGEYTSCTPALAGGTPDGEPPESEFGDKAKK
jgi:hypothetical protein